MKTTTYGLISLAILAIIFISSQTSAVVQKDEVSISFPDHVMKNKEGYAKITIQIDIKGTHLDRYSDPTDIVIYDENFKIIIRKDIDIDTTYHTDYHTSIFFITRQNGTVPCYLMLYSGDNTVISEWHNVTVSEYSNENLKIVIGVGIILTIIIAVIGIILMRRGVKKYSSRHWY
jgi:hypothetical protein